MELGGGPRETQGRREAGLGEGWLEVQGRERRGSVGRREREREGRGGSRERGGGGRGGSRGKEEEDEDSFEMVGSPLARKPELPLVEEEGMQRRGDEGERRDESVSKGRGEEGERRDERMSRKEGKREGGSRKEEGKER
jgi:hypothetical protein